MLLLCPHPWLVYHPTVTHRPSSRRIRRRLVLGHSADCSAGIRSDLTSPCHPCRSTWKQPCTLTCWSAVLTPLMAGDRECTGTMTVVSADALLRLLLASDHPSALDRAAASMLRIGTVGDTLEVLPGPCRSGQPHAGADQPHAGHPITKHVRPA